MKFQDFSFDPRIGKGIAHAGYVNPTPIQAKAMGPVMDGRDVMGLAQTGTGKTAAFVLPLLHRLLAGSGRGVRALVVAPTRELAEQIHEAVETLGRHTGMWSTSIYGGVGLQPQIQKLRRGPAVVVACPGRLIDHINRGTADLSGVETLVIDEADQMFDMGFFPDIRRILSHVPKRRQTLFFSATMPEPIRVLAEEVLTDPVTVRIGATAPAETVSHALFPVAQHLKTALLMKLLRQIRSESVLVFTRTKHRAKSLEKKLSRAGYEAASLQGNLSQNKRQAALSGFREGRVRILVATDIAARGIDVTRVSHVINFDVPSTPEAYIHRIGRTGRASKNGEAFTLVTGDDGDMVRSIDRIIGSRVERRMLADFDYACPDNRGLQHTSAKPAHGGSKGGNKAAAGARSGGRTTEFSRKQNSSHGVASGRSGDSRKKRRPSGRPRLSVVRSAA